MHVPIKSKRGARQEIASSRSRTAPLKGWNAKDSEAAMTEGWALYLDNWFPTPTNVQLRKGATNHVTGLGTTPIKSLAVWNARSGSPSRRIFACADTGIYDATTAGVFGAASSAITDGRVISTNFGTTGGSFLFCVNGVDSIRYYDGAAWTVTSSYPINGGGTLTSSTISYIDVFKRSLYMLVTGAMEFYYLPIDSITGTVNRFPLGALFKKGGSLLAFGSWSVDGGQGVDDYAAFVTTEGQIALYKGTDPSSASTWALQGVYDLSRPLGKKCLFKYGGDLLYLSKDGVYPLSKALQSSVTQLTTAITDNISAVFSASATSYGRNWGWQGIASFQDSLLLFNVPAVEYSTSQQYVMNTKTGAWCRFTDWNAFCWEIMDDQLYMGMTGKVAKAWTGLNDFGGIISCYAKGAYDYFGMRARTKQVNLVRPALRITGSIAVDVAVDVDFSIGTDYGPSVFNPANGSLWDVALWDQGMWTDVAATRLDWITVAAKDGYNAAPRLRVLSRDGTVEWSATDFVFETGGIKN